MKVSYDYENQVGAECKFK